ncbi:MAG: ABC transporter permease [Bulleidia sp.]
MFRTRSSRTLFIMLAILSFLSLFIGVADLDLSSLLHGDADQWMRLLASRVPRLLAILCTGAGMSVAGLIMQQLTRNKFVSPTTGTTISSSELGILIAMLFFKDSTLMQRAGFAFFCALAGTWTYVWFIQNIRFQDTVMVPLIGIMMSSIITGITSALAYRFDMSQALSSWLSGHFSLVVRGKYELVWLTAPLLVLAYAFSSWFSIAGMGKNFSRNLGVAYERVVLLGLTLASMITASVVAVVGAISYVGLIIPNIVSLFHGDNMKGILPETAYAGCLFVLVCDILARIVIFPFEVSVDLVIGIFGTVLFIALLFHQLKHGRKAIRGKAHA